MKIVNFGYTISDLPGDVSIRVQPFVEGGVRAIFTLGREEKIFDPEALRALIEGLEQAERLASAMEVTLK